MYLCTCYRVNQFLVKFRDKVRLRRFYALSTSFLTKSMRSPTKWHTQYSLSNLYCFKNYDPNMLQILSSQVNTHRNSHGVNYSLSHALSCQNPYEIQILISISSFLDCFRDKLCKSPILFGKNRWIGNLKEYVDIFNLDFWLKYSYSMNQTEIMLTYFFEIKNYQKWFLEFIFTMFADSKRFCGNLILDSYKSKF